MLWLWERAGESHAPVGCAEFRAWQRIEPEVLATLIDHVVALGFVRRYAGYGGSGAGGPLVLLRPEGAEQARRLARRRENDGERRQYALRAVLEWLRQRRGHTEPRLGEFFDSAQIFFLGTALSWEEVSDAVDWLSDVDLLVRTEAEPGDARGPRVSLTGDGREFVWSGARLEEYLRQRRERARPVVRTHIARADKVQIAGRDLHSADVRYSVELRPAELGVLIGALAPQLELDADSLDELLRLSRQLTRYDPDAGPGDGGSAAGSGSGDGDPDDGRVRGTLRRMRELVSVASRGSAREVVDVVIGQVLSRALGG
ncbi:hypothetical protein E0L36_24420 [Streptomyces sp. AJS327]|nr:hypothetical protein [Streptomyces sp. AJS327]